jgi:hypothetical protein
MSQSITRQRFKELLTAGAIGDLFLELGWDHADDRLTVDAGKEKHELRVVANKRGFAVLVHSSEVLPDRNLRQSIEKKVARIHFEHLIVYRNAVGTQQLWQLALRRPNQPITFHETAWHKGQEPELLYQKLSGLFIPLAEEDKITLVDVRERVSKEFERQTKDVTKKFYRGFKKEHDSFLKFIEGLNDQDAKKWYASLMLNRLMFIYFLQRKGFMDGKTDYLGEKLNETEKTEGKDKFYGFYRNFLRVLFHQGLGDPKRTPELEKRIGKVPYLNGGLFDEHDLEKDNPKIQIKDEAFKKLFAFFNEWNWTLDTRQQASGKEVNPDVIGYIFEQYINDRAQMGAYYTKEDITDYIAKNTIIPWLFDAAKAKDAQAFKPEGGVWELLRNDPDRYIHASVKHGVDPALMELDKPKLPWHKSPIFNDLDDELRAGLDPDQKDLVAKRKCWNHRAVSSSEAENKALPTEIWRETIERRRRYLEVRRKLAAGEVTAINDLITYNLDIKQFAQDVLHEHESGDLVWAFYDAIQHITVLDPTCGSGAFLFAALGILQPLYEECLQRMAEFREQAKTEGKPKRWQQFQPILDRIAKHHANNRDYFIYKSIILQNLYGVDIMPEAVEIAKLRLFLKLVSTVEPDPKKPSYGIEPLPDIDFNIRTGNTLVGFGTKAELDKGLEYTMDGQLAKPVIEEKCHVVDTAFERYKQIQLNEGEDYATFHAAKETLQERLKILRDELDRYLGKQYGKDADHRGGKEYVAWKKSHQPFHWFAEYYGIVEGRGGFDVIVGNPPYVEYSKVKADYAIPDYRTKECGNLYAYVIERGQQIVNAQGYWGYIIPLSGFSTARMAPLQKLISDRGNYFSSFDFRPSKLFDGVNMRLSICVSAPNWKVQHSTSYLRWYSDTRDTLFSNRVAYAETSINKNGIPKLSTLAESALWEKVSSTRQVRHSSVNSSSYSLYFHDAILYWIRATDFPPAHGDYLSSHVKEVDFRTKAQLELACSVVNSALYYWWWTKGSNCRDLNVDEVLSFPIDLDAIQGSGVELMQKHKALMKDFMKNSEEKVRIQKQTGAVHYREFNPVRSKDLIDEIDTLLAQHYGLSAEELDFIINYDIKYRMGSELEGEGE